MADRGPKKDYAESHGMTHGGFRDFIKTHGEAKTSEQLATERAVAQARAAVVAKQKVGELQASGRNLNKNTMNAELDAQAARAKALAHLQKHSCGPSQFELTGVVAKTSTSDNTLEVLAKRKAKAAASEAVKANALKAKLLQQQASLRNKTTGDDANGGIPKWWKEIPDAKTGAVYYWNELTNETSWEKPKSESSSSSTSSEGGNRNLPKGWVQKTHESTGQVVYENQVTKERRWEKPNAFDDVSDIQPSASLQDAAPIKFSLGGNKGMDKKDDPKKRKSEQGEKKGKKEPKFDWQKSRKIDPMDPLGQEGGKNSQGSNNPGERMADSTASGPLFQQRPYPAPGSVLRSGDPKKK